MFIVSVVSHSGISSVGLQGTGLLGVLVTTWWIQQYGIRGLYLFGMASMSAAYCALVALTFSGNHLNVQIAKLALLTYVVLMGSAAITRASTR